MILSPDDFLIRSDGSYDWTPSRVSSAWTMTMERVHEALLDPRYKQLVLLIGVPASGKTSWLRAHARIDSVYVDATFTLPSSRRSFLQLAASLNKPCQAVLLTTPFEECLRRNSLRSSDREVPLERMILFSKQLHSAPPTLSEGFVEILIVSST